MQVSNIFHGLPLNVSERIPFWTNTAISKPYRVWVIEHETHSSKPIGVMAQSLKELKQKAKKFIVDQTTSQEVADMGEISILTMDSTLITDEEYFQHFSNTEDLVMLLPGQSWTSNLVSGTSSSESDKDYNARLNLVKRKNDKNDFRYFVPTPDGELARLTVDVFRQEPADAGSVRLTAATAGDAGMAVSYEIKLNGFRTVLHYAFRWTAFLLTHVGHALTNTGELLKQYA